MEVTELPPAQRRIFCNRTLNLRSIRAIGFDMDYTLIHYRAEVWEAHAFAHAQKRLGQRGWPVENLDFDPAFASLGLILDVERGNIVKANRFGYVKKACHGTNTLTFDQQRHIYARHLVDLSEPRWRFLNTLFALSEAHLYAQCVDLLDQGKLSALGHLNYRDIYDAVRSAIDEAHMTGHLKEEIMQQPDRFVELDPELPLSLQDLRHAGKKLLLITNSEWFYTKAMMSYAFDRFLPQGTWRDLFDLVVVSARKPSFFSHENAIFEVVDEERGTLQPILGNQLKESGAYLGGHAQLVEQLFDVRGEDVLYVGDHIFSDVNVSKKMHRWRTALVVRELEQDLIALENFKSKQKQLNLMMKEKARLEHQYSQIRLALQRRQYGYGPQVVDEKNRWKTTCKNCGKNCSRSTLGSRHSPKKPVHSLTRVGDWSYVQATIKATLRDKSKRTRISICLGFRTFLPKHLFSTFAPPAVVFHTTTYDHTRSSRTHPRFDLNI